ncbi:MAG: hypothetical protein PHC88_11220 [Terrimicrobiaceae bacterium]|nr:hypothetical protein [Terrimicrobiaceae bacterium]
MKVASFEAIVRALNDAEVRYIVVGGLAVIAHGYLRLTTDVDIVIRLTPLDISRAFEALAGIDYHPAVPITAKEFSDPSLREQWRTDKHMLVLKMWSDLHRETPLDIFIYEPFDFDREYEQALIAPESDVPPARFAAIPALIEMKRIASRDRDRIDIAKLREIERLRET